jgi:ABC-2 type transport system permease protein
MPGNSAFQIIEQQGWQAGLKNMLNAEFKSWWKTRTWWVQCLIWIGVVDLILLTIFLAANSGDELALPLEEIVTLYGIFGGMFTSIGVIITMQGAIVGEKISGTAAWILSKPISRPAFVISKFLANAFGVAVTAIIVPGIVAYFIISLGTGAYLPVQNFVMGMGVLLVFALYWLAFTLMLGAFFNSRGPVIGIPLALILGQQFILGLILSISPAIVNFLPFLLIMPPQDGSNAIVGNVILGQSPGSWFPVLSSIFAAAIFLIVGIWRLTREEF